MTPLAARLLIASATAAVMALAGCTSGSTEPGATPSSPAAAGEGSPPVQLPVDESPAEHDASMVRCMRDKGWDTFAVRGGGIGTRGVPDEQMDQYRADEEKCYADLGFGVGQPPTVTRGEAEELYDVLLEVADCVRGLGYSVPEAPSRQAFVEQLISYPIPEWHPYDVLYETADTASIQQAEAQCPIPDMQ
jgi:hypothetical protein